MSFAAYNGPSFADEELWAREREAERISERRALSRRAGYRVAGTLRALRMREAMRLYTLSVVPLIAHLEAA